MHPISGLTNKLQGSSIDVIESYANVSSCVDDIAFQLSKVFNQAGRMVVKFDVQPCIPRVAARQMHRNNVPADTPREYFKRAFVIPLLDKFIAEMEFRSNNLNKSSSRLL